MRPEYARCITAQAIAGLHMQKLCFIAAAVAIASLQGGVSLAQNAPASGDTTATPSAAAAGGAAAAPAATTDKAAATATTAPADKPASTTTDTSTDKSAETKKKKTASKKMTRQQELDRSIDTGTVPSRYKSQIPKEYHGNIPWGR